MKTLRSDATSLSELQLSKLITKDQISSDDGIIISNFSDLVKEIAELSFKNHENTLFFRGQREDFKKLNGIKSTLNPSIYRDRVNAKNNNLKSKKMILKKAS